MRLESGAKAWPLSAFQGRRVLNDQVGGVNVVLIGDAETRTVRAYERGDRLFRAAPGGGLRVTAREGDWQITEAGLLGPAGEGLARLPGHVAYWFAWAGYLGERSELFTE